MRGATLREIRKFLGIRDIECVAMCEVFPESPAIVASPVSLEESWPLIIHGPEHHINFLYPLMKKMLKSAPLSSDGEGWVGVNHENSTLLNLFYVYNDVKLSPNVINLAKERARKIELLQSKFRSDAAKYADIKFSETAKIEVIWEDKVAISGMVTLPKDFKNGSITLPTLWLH